ncbi:MAG: DUF3182 family protein [Burkholderiales bacterium]|nr:DUF3182 family protein [Burkholderiales bacterium]
MGNSASDSSRRVATSTACRETVVSYRGSERPGGHEALTCRWVAQSLASIKGCECGGEFDAQRDYGSPLYFVPLATIDSLEEARRLGIEHAGQLFGGVVPMAFIATKIITHPLLADDAAAPSGWSREFGARVRDVVLPGYSVFSRADARRAGALLLAEGAVRAKRSCGVGGSGQAVAADARQLEAFIDGIDDGELASQGLVLERNLDEAQACSVGQVRVGELLASYVGTQRQTRNHRGALVYGGSTLTVVRGGYDALLGLSLLPDLRTAVKQALVYHDAAFGAFAGMFASRCNYDVAQGVDQQGRPYSGVLEQSWRIGGATPAEIAALETFKAYAEVRVVAVSSVETYELDPVLPDHAVVFYSGVDAHAGALTKYLCLEPHAGL